MWLHVAAAAAQILHSPPGTQDLEKADVLLTLIGEHFGEVNPAVKVQVKTTTELRETADDMFAYDLDVETYDVLRKVNHRVRRVLLVVQVPDDERWAHQGEYGLLLPGQERNTLDKEELIRMLCTYGVSRSTPVPNFDECGGAE
jgi:hypothetical protein